MNNGINSVIQEGIKLLGVTQLTERMFNVWLSYSINMLRLVCRNTAIIQQYTSSVLGVLASEVSPHEKLSHCLKLLLSINQLL